MLHSQAMVVGADELSADDPGVRLWCELFLLYFEAHSITSTSLKEVLGLKWKTIKKRMKSGSIGDDEIRLLREHLQIDPWRAMLALVELKKPAAYFDPDMAWCTNYMLFVFRALIERVKALDGDFIPLRKGLDRQAEKVVDELLAHQRRFQDFTN